MLLSVTKENRIGPETMTAEIIDDDHFKCPECGGTVTITYWNDSRGRHSDVGLHCDRCPAIYSINLVK